MSVMASQRPNVLLSCTVNLFIAAAGAGLLSYPWAMLQQGVLPCVIFSAFFCVVNAFTDMVLVSAAHSAADSPPPSGAVTCVHWHAIPHSGFKHLRRFEHVVGVLLGGRAKMMATALNLVSCFGATVCFLILVADILLPVTISTCSTSGGAFVCFFARSRIALISAFAFAIALPFSLADNMGHLAGASAIAALSVFVIAGLLGDQAVAAPAAGSPQFFNFSSALVLGIPISIFSFGNHTQVALLNQLKRIFVYFFAGGAAVR
jgi:amino acid permease